MNKTKLLGQTFTNEKEVNYMLEMYKGNWLTSKIMEPSFGDGAFLTKVVEKIIKEGRQQKLPNDKIISILENNLWGYELDEGFYNETLINLKNIMSFHNIKNDINWKHLENKSTFKCVENNFDLVIGNPPYVRIQNFENVYKKYTSDLIFGNTDLFLIFIDFYLRKISKNGQMIFIVPNSLGKSKAARRIRNHMTLSGSVTYIDYESKQLFNDVSVYSSIFNYHNNSLSPSLFKVDDLFVSFADHDMWLPVGYTPLKYDDIGVRNGIATLGDKYFITSTRPNVEPEAFLRLYKGSKQEQEYWILFPYKRSNNTYKRFSSEEELKETFPLMYDVLHKNKKTLSKRSLEKGAHWFEYGRSQGIKDYNKPKIVIDTLLKPNQTKIRTTKIPKDTLVFSGLYTTNLGFEKYNTEEFVNGVRFTSKDLRGAYKKLSSSNFR